MGVLNAFLNPTAIDDTKKVIVSKRFLDENGEPVPFEIRAISQEENHRITKKYTRGKVVNGNKVDVFDTEKYTNALIVRCTVQPEEVPERCRVSGV